MTKPRILLVHHNAPGQFGRLASALIADGHDVAFMGDKRLIEGKPFPCKVIPYEIRESDGGGIHPYLDRTDSAVRHGQAALRALLLSGYRPDIIYGHSGWGEMLFLKDGAKNARILAYMEYYYRASGQDIDFDPEFKPLPDTILKQRILNMHFLATMDSCDGFVSPTQWQRSTFPAFVRDRIEVIHDGIDTSLIRAIPQWTGIPGVKPGSPIVTFASRCLEPYRGFHVFMRALPEMQQRLPKATFVLVDGGENGYGPKPVKHPNWPSKLREELGNRVDWERVLMLQRLPYEQLIGLIKASHAHVYMTYPFVLSWSLLEAMASGAPIVASDTAPVSEVIMDGLNGRLVPFFDSQALAQTVAETVRDGLASSRLREGALETATQAYDFRLIYPKWKQWLTGDATGVGP